MRHSPTSRCLLGGLLIVVALGGAASISGANGASAFARVRFLPGTDVLSVSQFRALGTGAAGAAEQAAAAAGAHSTLVIDGTIGMLSLRRGDTIVQRTPSGWRIPMTFTALDPPSGAALYGTAIGDALGADQIAMGALTASLRGAQPGDVVELRGWNGKVKKVAIAAISDQAPSELVLSLSLATALGVTRSTRVVMWGFTSREDMDAALAAHGLPSATVRVTDSWEPAYADDTLSQSRTKAMAGEFAVRGSTRLQLPASWIMAHITNFELHLGPRTLIGRCNKVLVGPLVAVFDAITAAGLAPLTKVGGQWSTALCFSAREVRSLGSTTGGTISRHTWAVALDLNVKANCIGCVPVMDCRIVQIFRANGFAWGGNFLTPDGMHFEYVGEPRDQVPTRPGAYCPTSPPVDPPPSTTVSGEVAAP